MFTIPNYGWNVYITYKQSLWYATIPPYKQSLWCHGDVGALGRYHYRHAGALGHEDPLRGRDCLELSIAGSAQELDGWLKIFEDPSKNGWVGPRQPPKLLMFDNLKRSQLEWLNHQMLGKRKHMIFNDLPIFSPVSKHLLRSYWTQKLQVPPQSLGFERDRPGDWWAENSEQKAGCEGGPVVR